VLSIPLSERLWSEKPTMTVIRQGGEDRGRDDSGREGKEGLENRESLLCPTAPPHKTKGGSMEEALLNKGGLPLGCVLSLQLIMQRLSGHLYNNMQSLTINKTSLLPQL
jgi:hypothetical protein